MKNTPDCPFLELRGASLLLGICHVTRTVPRRRIAPRWKQRKPLPVKPRTLGEHLKQARVDKGLTIKQAGQKMGVHYRSVVVWESDRCRPKPHHLEAIRDFLGYDLPEIYRKSPKSQFLGYLPPI